MITDSNILYYLKGERLRLWALSLLLIFPSQLCAETDSLRRLGLSLPGILFLYNGSPLDRLSSVTEDHFTTADAARVLAELWQVENREQLLHRLTELGSDGTSGDFRYLRSLVDTYGKALESGKNDGAKEVGQLFQSGDEQVQGLTERLRTLYPSLDPFDLLRLNLIVQMKRQFGLFPRDLRGWDMARVVALARWGYDLGFLPESEAWRYIEFAAREVRARFTSWNEYVENYVYGRLFEYASVPQAPVILRDSALLWWELRDKGGGWEQWKLNVYEPTRTSPLLQLFQPLYSFQQAVRQGNITAAKAWIERQHQLRLPLLGPADGPLYLPLDQPDAHRRSVLSLAVGNYQMLNLLLSSGFRYDSGDDEGRPALYWAIAESAEASAQNLLASYRRSNDRLGRGPLHWAAINGSAALLTTMMDAGFDLYAADGEGNTPLHLAARFARLPGNQALWDRVDAGALGRGNVYGESALHLALLNRADRNVAPLMLQRFSGELALDRADGKGRTALMVAARERAADAVLLLLERGANTRAVDAGGWTALHHATAAGSLVITRLLLRYNRDTINTRAHDGTTPLMLAARLPDQQVLSLLLFSGADPLVVDGQGRQALHYAAETGLPAVRILLEAGAELDATDQRGWGPLWYAISAGQKELVSYLLDSGALNGVEPSLQPLLLAVQRSDYSMLRLLLDREFPVSVEGDTTALLAEAARAGNYRVFWSLGEAGADWDRPDTEGNMPLHVASLEGSAEMVRYLLRQGSDAKAVNAQRQTALHLAAQDLYEGEEKIRLLAEHSDLEVLSGTGMSALSYAALAGNFPAVRTLLNEGARVNGSPSAWPPLVAAARSGNIEVMTLLLERGADVDAASERGAATALHFAVVSRKNVFWTIDQREHFIRRVLAAGTMVNQADASGNTPLFWAASEGDERLVALLLAQGANPYLSNQNGLTALQYALESSWGNSYLLLRHGGSEMVNKADAAGLLPLERAAQWGDKQTVQLLLALGADADALGDLGYRPLFFALHARRPDNLLTLLRAGANPRLLNKAGEGLLGYSLRTEVPSDNVVALLGALPPTDPVDTAGNTALHLAISQGRGELVADLLAAGNPVNAVNADGNTALHLAVILGHAEAVQQLMRAGANPYVNNKKNQSAAQLALENGNEKMVRLMEQTTP